MDGKDILLFAVHGDIAESKVSKKPWLLKCVIDLLSIFAAYSKLQKKDDVSWQCSTAM